jgi:hypothetical protein
MYHLSVYWHYFARFDLKLVTHHHMAYWYVDIAAIRFAVCYLGSTSK